MTGRWSNPFIVHVMAWAFAGGILPLYPPSVSGIEVDFVYVTDPAFPTLPADTRLLPRRLELWLEALTQPERGLKIKAAEAIAREAQRGDPILISAIPALRAALSNAEVTDASVRWACACALIALNSRESADELMRHALQDEGALAEIVEPVLATWKHRPMQDAWVRRLNDPKLPLRPTVLAIRAASVMEIQESIPKLREISLSREPRTVLRLEAAQALSTLQLQGLEADAEKLQDRGPVDALVAVTMLSHHDGPVATALLLKFAVHSEPAVAAVALRRLYDIAPHAVEPLNATLTVHEDATIRELTARILQKQQSAAAVRALGSLLADRHPQVRRQAREALIALDQKDELRSEVRNVAMQALADEQPLGQEQAALVVGAVDHKPAAERLVQLLDSTHHPTLFTSAWALRRLQVAETAPAMLERFRRETEQSLIPLPLETKVDYTAVKSRDQQLGHLIEALGLLRVREAVPTLLLYLAIPPQQPEKPVEIRLDTVWVPHLRLQAVWALGYIGQDSPSPDLVARLREKLTDGDDGLIRGMSAISLGRMQMREFLPEFRAAVQPPGSYEAFKFGCAWAVHHLTGDAIPAWKLTPVPAASAPTFLEPLGP